MGMSFYPLLSTLINFAVKSVTFPLLTVKTQSPARTNFFASFIPAALLPLLIVLFGFCVTKTNELIIPLAEKVLLMLLSYFHLCSQVFLQQTEHSYSFEHIVIQEC